MVKIGSVCVLPLLFVRRPPVLAVVRCSTAVVVQVGGVGLVAERRVLGLYWRELGLREAVGGLQTRGGPEA